MYGETGKKYDFQRYYYHHEENTPEESDEGEMEKDGNEDKE